MRTRTIAVTIVVATAVLLSGCSPGTSVQVDAAGSSAASATAPSRAAAATASPSPTPTDSALPPPSPPPVTGAYPEGRGPAGDPPLFVDGTWLAGTDMPAGVWRTTQDAADVYGCEWSITTADGSPADTGVSTGLFATVRLEDGDLFTSAGCLVWNYLGTAYTGEGVGIPTFTKDVGKPVQSGAYIAGRGIPAGEYKLVNPFDGPCTLTVKYEDRAGEIFTAIEYSSTTSARALNEVLLTLDRGAIFEADGCGDWQRYRYTFG